MLGPRFVCSWMDYRWLYFYIIVLVVVFEYSCKKKDETNHNEYCNYNNDVDSGEGYGNDSKEGLMKLIITLNMRMLRQRGRDCNGRRNTRKGGKDGRLVV